MVGTMLNIISSDTLIGQRRFGCVSFDTHSEIQSVRHVLETYMHYVDYYGVIPLNL